jgi:two-component system sensor histidine kinase DesK
MKPQIFSVQRPAQPGEGDTAKFAFADALIASVWLVFLFFPVAAIYLSQDSDAVKIYGYTMCGVFAVVYFLGFGLLSHWKDQSLFFVIIGWIATLCLIVLSLAPIQGVYVLAFSSWLIAAVIFSFPNRFGVGVCAAWIIVSTTISAIVDPDMLLQLSMAMLISPLIIIVIALLVARADARAEITAQLNLSRERENISRDVHDLLGHSLTVMNLKAELAEKLINSDVERARAEMAEIAHLSRVALAEVRSTVTRLQSPDFPGELAAAERALTTAQIRATTPSEAAYAQLSHSNATLFSWVVRECVTNIIRHADATTSEILVTESKIQVNDNGRGFDTSRLGNGLRGLKNRVEDAGGTFIIDSSPQHGTRTLVSMVRDTAFLEAV